jgi:hypothetical protein
VDFQVEFVGLNREKVTLDRYFTESHPLLEEVSEVLMSRFDEVTILTDKPRKKLVKKVACLKNMPASNATGDRALLERYFQWVYHVCSFGWIWHSFYDSLRGTFTEELSDPAYDTTGVVPEPFSVDGFVSNVIGKLNGIEFPRLAQPTIPASDARFAVAIALCNALNQRTQGMQLGGLFRHYRKLRSPEEIPNNGRIELVTVGAKVGVVDHTYVLLVKADDICVVNGYAAMLTFRPKGEFAFYDIRVIERFPDGS